MSSPSELNCTCGNCGHKLWGQRRGEWTLANKILKLAKGTIHAKCPGCGNDVPVPFLALAADETPRKRLVTRRRIAFDKAG